MPPHLPTTGEKGTIVLDAILDINSGPDKLIK